MNRTAIALAFLLLASCGGGKPNQPPPAGPITISDPMSYLAQSRGTNGDASTPLRAEDPMIYRRFDFGHHQASDSFLTGPNAAITTWSYSPFGPYVEANGDGGERMELRGDKVFITHTKHLGIPTTAISWVVLTTSTIDCAQGWTAYNPIEHGCRTTVNYPAIGPVDTVISEHRHPLEPTMERIFLARGWGRLAWQAFRTSGTLDNPARCPEFGWNAYEPGWILVDCRVAVNIEPWDGKLTGAMLWHP